MLNRCSILLAALLLGGCGYRPLRDLHVTIESVETHGTAGASLRLHVDNAGPDTVRLEAAEAILFYDGREVLRAVLKGPATIAPLVRNDLRLLWRLRIPDRAALYAVRQKLARAQTDRLRVSVALRPCTGGKTKNIGRRMPLSDFLNIFGLRPEDLLTDFE